MIVINLFGGPGSGKSTTAAALFALMKSFGKRVEYVTEYAKDMVYENRRNILEDQVYIFAKQARRLSRLEEHVDYVIMDSPLLLSCVYANNNYGSNFLDLVESTFNMYTNVNYLLVREKEYQQYGRTQTKEEACKIDEKIREYLVASKTPFIECACNSYYISAFIYRELFRPKDISPCYMGYFDNCVSQEMSEHDTLLPPILQKRRLCYCTWWPYSCPNQCGESNYFCKLLLEGQGCPIERIRP